MGSSIIFGFLYKLTKNNFYKEIYHLLIDEIADEISSNNETNFENGIAGIGFGFEVLSNNGLININDNDILNTIDKTISNKNMSDNLNIGLLNGHCGYVYYYIYRLKNRNNSENTKLFLELKLIELLYQLINKINNKSFIFKEPRVIDLLWDPIVLLLLCFELAKMNNVKKELKTLYSSLINKLNDIKITIKAHKILIKLLINLYTQKNEEQSQQLFSELNKLFQITKKVIKIQNNYIGLCVIYWYLGYLTNVDFLRICNYRYLQKLIVLSIKHDLSSNCLQTGLQKKGIIIGLLFNAFPSLKNEILFRKNKSSYNKKENNSKIHSKSIDVIFVPYLLSGAKTYANDIIKYLSSRNNISLSVINISSESKEYEFANNDGYNYIEFPSILNNKDNTAKYVSESLERAYYSRLVIFIKYDLLGHKNAIFHFNYANYRIFVKMIKQKLKAITILTWHFFPEIIYKLEYIENIQSLKYHDLHKSELELYGNPKIFDAVICISEFAQKALVKYYNYSQAKTKVIWNGTSRFKPILPSERDKLRIKYELDKCFIILFAGRIEQRKGIKELLNAFSLISQRFRNIHLIIAGTGDYDLNLPKCLNFMNRVSFVGEIPIDKLQELYQISDLGIIPSCWELFGYVLIEMMHSGLAVIGTKVPGMQEILSKFYCDKNMIKVELINNNLEVNVSSLINEIERMIRNNNYRKHIAISGMKCANEYFTLDQMGLKTVNFYKELLKFNE
jgi:glycosyltransferase involved in cell wall biosynthesis